MTARKDCLRLRLATTGRGRREKRNRPGPSVRRGCPRTGPTTCFEIGITLPLAKGSDVDHRFAAVPGVGESRQTAPATALRGRLSRREGNPVRGHHAAVTFSKHLLTSRFALAIMALLLLVPPALAQEVSNEDAAATEPPVSTLDLPAAAAEDAAIAERNLFNIIQQGGPLLIPILVCSFILFLFVFERLFSLRRRRVIPKPFVRQFLHQLREGSVDQDEALQLCRKNGSAVARVFAGAVQKWGRPAVEVEQGIIDAGERVSNGLRRYLRLINGIATVTPLLGLLGTVVGMIQAFNDIATADAMGKPELLAAGIGQALITTAGGLTVAIPALIAYMFFISRVDRLVMDIDALSQDVVAEISAEAQSKTKRSGRKAA